MGGSYVKSRGHYSQIRSSCSSDQFSSLWIPTNCTTMIPNDFCTSAKQLLGKSGNVMHDFQDDHLVLSVSGCLRILCSPFVVFPLLQRSLSECFWSVILLSLWLCDFLPALFWFCLSTCLTVFILFSDPPPFASLDAVTLLTISAWHLELCP